MSKMKTKGTTKLSPRIMRTHLLLEFELMKNKGKKVFNHMKNKGKKSMQSVRLNILSMHVRT